jgi:hypothetical protein
VNPLAERALGGKNWPVVKEALGPLLPLGTNHRELRVARTADDLEELAKTNAILIVGDLANTLTTRTTHVSLESFSHRYAFRVVPSISAPRALVPPRAGRNVLQALLGARSQASQPLKRLTLFGMRTIPKFLELTSAPCLLALANTSDIAKLVSRLAPRSSLGVFLGNPSRYHKPSLHAFNPEGRRVVIVKYASRQEDQRRLAHEYEVLKYVREHVSALAQTVPGPLGYIRGHLGHGLLTDSFRGSPAPTRLSAPLRRWLECCRLPVRAPLGKSSLIGSLKELQQRTDEPLIKAAIKKVLDRRLLGFEVQRTIVHGDFIPWNMVIDSGQTRVFDWEYACLDGVPGWDETYFSLQVGLVLRRWGVRQLVKGAVELSKRPAEPYDSEIYRSIILLVLASLAHRNALEGNRKQADAIRDAIADLLATGW